MSNLILIHVVTGLAGIAAGVFAVGGIFYGRRMAYWNAVFLSATAIACATGLIFLPTVGVQPVLAGCVLPRHSCWSSRHSLDTPSDWIGSWNQVYAFTAVGALFLNVLITTTQLFRHIAVLKEVAPISMAQVHVTVKDTLVVVFIVVAILGAKRAGRA